jgi:hypothetical protein
LLGETEMTIKMIEKETTYKLTLTEIEAIKLLRLLDTMCDVELWDNDLESIYYEMKESVDTEKFNRFMETGK